jgi:hypothetical protein
MNTFTPEFAALWRSEAEDGARGASTEPRESPGLSPSQQVALEELAERVTAARSVI